MRYTIRIMKERAMTMTYEEIVAEARQLPPKERRRLVDELSRSIPDEPAILAANGDDWDTSWWQAFEARRRELLKDVPPDSSAHTLLGIARMRRDVPMTKEETREALTEALNEKYLQ